jgi:hypothetical protein
MIHGDVMINALVNGEKQEPYIGYDDPELGKKVIASGYLRHISGGDDPHGAVE